MLVLLLSLSLANELGCLVIDQPQVTAETLATRLPAFSRLPAGTVLSASPNFGMRRDLSSATLRAWAVSYGADTGSLDPICIYRKAAAEQDISWEAELREALDGLFGFKPGPAEIEILEHTVAPGPSGKLSLERNGLILDTQRQQYLWRGRLIGSGSYAAVRIRFALHRNLKRLVTARPLSAGNLLRGEDIMSIEVLWRPGSPKTDILLEAPIGKALRRSLPKGTILESFHLMEPPLIQQGDPVELFSSAGEATIRISAIALGKARLGDPILISTLEGKRLLRAIAVAPGKVEIQAGRVKKTR